MGLLGLSALSLEEANVPVELMFDLRGPCRLCIFVRVVAAPVLPRVEKADAAQDRIGVGDDLKFLLCVAIQDVTRNSMSFPRLLPPVVVLQNSAKYELMFFTLLLGRLIAVFNDDNG